MDAFESVVLEKTLESPLDCKEIQPMNPKGNQSWIFIGKTNVEAEGLIFRPPDPGANSLEKTWCWERLRAGGEGATEDKMVGWHHRLNGHEFEQTLGDNEGQRSPARCSPWGCKELDMTEWLSNNHHIPEVFNISTNHWGQQFLLIQYQKQIYV